MVPVGGFLSHGEPLKFLVWGCFQSHFMQVDEDSIGNWYLVSFFYLLTWLDACHNPKSRKWPKVNFFFELEACPDNLEHFLDTFPPPTWCVSSNLKAPSRSRFYTEMAELYFDWDFRMVGMSFYDESWRFFRIFGGCWLLVDRLIWTKRHQFFGAKDDGLDLIFLGGLQIWYEKRASTLGRGKGAGRS